MGIFNLLKGYDTDDDSRTETHQQQTEKMKLNLNYAELIKQRSIDLYHHEGLVDNDLDILYQVIEKSKVLQVLNLRGNKLTLADGKFATAIAKNTTIKEVNLIENNISEEGIKHLADALKENTVSKLDELRLGGNNIGDQGAEYIADMLIVNKTLQYIGLNDNNIGDKGAESIATSLAVNAGMRVIWLNSNNKITDASAEKLADALGSNHIVEYLGLGGNNISVHVEERIEAILNDSNRADKSQSSLNKLELFIAKQKDKELKGRNTEIAKKDRDNESLKEGLADAQKKITERDKDIAKKDKQLDQLESIKRILNPTGNEGEPATKRTRTEDTLKTPKVKSVLMNSDCSICCAKFSADLDSKVEDIRKHLPVLSSSKTCDHYFCHGCILKQQLELAQKNNGRFPNWIPCMICKTKTAFRPSEPKYHRLLIGIY